MVLLGKLVNFCYYKGELNLKKSGKGKTNNVLQNFALFYISLFPAS